MSKEQIGLACSTLMKYEGLVTDRIQLGKAVLWSLRQRDERSPGDSSVSRVWDLPQTAHLSCKCLTGQIGMQMPLYTANSSLPHVFITACYTNLVVSAPSRASSNLDADERVRCSGTAALALCCQPLTEEGSGAPSYACHSSCLRDSNEVFLQGEYFLKHRLTPGGLTRIFLCN